MSPIGRGGEEGDKTVLVVSNGFCDNLRIVALVATTKCDLKIAYFKAEQLCAVSLSFYVLRRRSRPDSCIAPAVTATPRNGRSVLFRSVPKG
jgi:hypothetical protein